MLVGGLESPHCSLRVLHRLQWSFLASILDAEWEQKRWSCQGLSGWDACAEEAEPSRQLLGSGGTRLQKPGLL